MGDSMTTLAPEIWSHLPPELILRLFHLAGSQSKKFCLTLSLVSSWTRQLVLPHLLSTVVLENEQLSLNFNLYISLDAVEHGQTALNRGQFVHNIWLSDCRRRFLGIYAGILRHCSNLSRLAVTTWGFLMIANNARTDRLVDLFERDLQLTVLHIGKTDGHLLNVLASYSTRHPPQRSPLFAAITHLQFQNGFDWSMSLIFEPKFDRLTHLAFPFASVVDLNSLPLERFLLSPTLKTCILVYYPFEFPSDLDVETKNALREIRDRDSRICWIIAPQTSTREVWEEESRGCESIWDRAEALWASRDAS